MNIRMEPYPGEKLADSRCRISLVRQNNWLNQYFCTDIDGSDFISNKMLFRMHNVYNVLYPVLCLHKICADFDLKKTLVSFQMIKK